MRDSILQSSRECWFCGRVDGLERHHIYGGNPNRRISETNGFVVWLCHDHHNEPPYGVHFNREMSLALKRECQTAFEKTHSREEFMRLIGRNYL